MTIPLRLPKHENQEYNESLTNQENNKVGHIVAWKVERNVAKTRQAKIKIKALQQVGFSVKDIEKTMKDYWNILGIGPHAISGLKPSQDVVLTYGGKPANYKFKASFAQVGPVELELIQSIEGHTIYDDYIAAHGEGANHLQYMVDSLEEMDKHVEIMSRNGFPMLMGGRVGSKIGFAYLDTVSALKTIWEVLRMPDKSFSRHTYPSDGSEVSPAKIKIRAITRIGIVVENLEEVTVSYRDILGIGPWDISEYAFPALHDVTFQGRAVNTKWRAALARVGPVQLELLQPLSGDNLYYDFLRKHGEGIHHLQFMVDDIERTNRIMAAEGFPVLMGGGLLDGGFAFYDTVGPLKIVREAFQPPKGVPHVV